MASGRVTTTATVPGRWAFASAPLARLLAWVPAARDTRAGARLRRAWKVAWGVAAALLAARAREAPGWAVPSLLALGLAVALPLSDVRRARWQRAAQGLARGVEVPREAAAEVTWDGTRVVVRAATRQFSARPAEAAVAVGRDDRGAWLALAPGGAGKQALAFRAREIARDLPSRPCPAPADRTVAVDAETWALLAQALAPNVAG